MTMTRLSSSFPAVVAGALAAVTLTALPAHAEQASHTDAARDVRAFRDEGGSAPRPNVENGDVRRFTAAHTQRKVTVRTTYRALRKNVDQLAQYVAFRTPRGEAMATVLAGPDGWGGQLSFRRPNGEDCPGATHAIDYRDDTFSFSVPRGCLGDPDWVRVGFGAATGAGEEQRGDDARLDNRLESSIALGPRLDRG